MGGILRKLVENQNQVDVAYQTCGNIAVFDHEVRRYLDFLERGEAVLGGDTGDIGKAVEGVREALAGKAPGEVDTPALRRLHRAQAVPGEPIDSLDEVTAGSQRLLSSYTLSGGNR